MTGPPSKTVGNKTYVHVDCVELLDAEYRVRLAEAERLAEIHRGEQYNIVRFDSDFNSHLATQLPGVFRHPVSCPKRDLDDRFRERSTGLSYL